MHALSWAKPRCVFAVAQRNRLAMATARGPPPLKHNGHASVAHRFNLADPALSDDAFHHVKKFVPIATQEPASEVLPACPYSKQVIPRGNRLRKLNGFPLMMNVLLVTSGAEK